jgi:hypothetical protein
MMTIPENLYVRILATGLSRSVVALLALTIATVIACAQSQTSPSPPTTASPPSPTETPATTPTTTVTRAPSPSEELNTLLMHATFLITGPAAGQPGRTSFGTVFVMGTPYKDNPKLAAFHFVLQLVRIRCRPVRATSPAPHAAQ